ncbi:MAG: hypothetical protein V5A38_14405, partial [Halolamina sp.]|uniref:hypothetical protein n=1 Tax=Halolamina sp. TaxID=1940283 RepID=UPI002FC35F1C
IRRNHYEAISATSTAVGDGFGRGVAHAEPAVGGSPESTAYRGRAVCFLQLFNPGHSATQYG